MEVKKGQNLTSGGQFLKSNTKNLRNRSYRKKNGRRFKNGGQKRFQKVNF